VARLVPKIATPIEFHSKIDKLFASINRFTLLKICVDMKWK